MRFLPLQHTLASLARVRGRQPSDRPASPLLGPCPAAPLARRTSPGLVLLEPPGGHWAVRVLPILPARGTCLINPDRHCWAALSVTNSTRSGPSFERFGRSLRGLAGPGSGPTALMGFVPFAVLLLSTGGGLLPAPPRPRAVNVALTRVIFHPEIVAEFSQTSLEVDIWRTIASASVSAAGFWPCRQAVPPRRLPAQAACPAMGFVLSQVLGHPPMDAPACISMPRRPTVPGPPLLVPFRSWALWQIVWLLTDVPHRLLLPVTS